MGLLAGKTLAAAVAPGDTHLTITPPLALGDNPAGQPIQIGSELMMVTGGKRGVLGLARAADSAHTSGTAITELNPHVASPEGGGGAIAVDNTVDAPVDVTGIVAVGASFDGTVATLRGKDFYAQDTDPGAVGAGSVWKDTTDGSFWTRNDTNDGWNALASRNAFAVVDEDADVSANAVANGIGYANAVATATASASGDADALIYASTVDGAADATSGAAASGTGAADTTATSTTLTGTATAGSLAVRNGVSAGVSSVVDGTSARMAFNGTTPIAIPEIPASPTEQDIADVLVALGLATQAA